MRKGVPQRQTDLWKAYSCDDATDLDDGCVLLAMPWSRPELCRACDCTNSGFLAKKWSWEIYCVSGGCVEMCF